MDTDSTQDSREEIIFPIDFEGVVIISAENSGDILRSTGIDRTGMLASDILFKPVRICNPYAKSSQAVSLMVF
jgi:hypothetical protein